MKIRITQWLWSVWAVVAGFLVTQLLGSVLLLPLAILANTPDPTAEVLEFRVGLTALYAVFGFFGGYITAKAAKHHKQGHALALALVFLSSTVFTLGAAYDLDIAFPWGPLIGVVLLSVGAYLGGWLYVKRNKKQESVKKQKNKKLILGHLVEHKRITNNDVEELLGLSDAGATIYLGELEKAGEIEQVGDTGRGVWYQLKK